MTTTPYPIMGVITDANGTVAASATLVVKNTQTGEILSGTTNASGEYSLDAANFSSGYTDGDKLYFHATLSPPLRIAEVRNVRINSTAGATVQNITLVQVSERDYKDQSHDSTRNKRIYSPTADATRVVVVDYQGLEETDERTTKVAYDGSNNPIYVGKTQRGGSTNVAIWQIKRITFDGSNNPTDIKWANGSDDYKFVWDDRTSYSYS